MEVGRIAELRVVRGINLLRDGKNGARNPYCKVRGSGKTFLKTETLKKVRIIACRLVLISFSPDFESSLERNISFKRRGHD